MAGYVLSTSTSGRRRPAPPHTRGSNNMCTTIRHRSKRSATSHVMRTPSSTISTRSSLECLRRINCRHLHLIIGNHDRNFRLRFNDMLYEDVFETIDDYCEIDMELPVLDESGKITVATTQQSIAMSHFPRLSALAEEHGDWPSNWNEFADMAPTTEGWLLYGHTHQDVPDGTDPRSVNVGLDAWDFKPVSEQQILAWLASRCADQSK